MCRSMVAEHGDAGRGVVSKVEGFLAELFLYHGSFKFMHHFTDTLSKLYKLGAEPTGKGKLIIVVAEASRDTPVHLNLSDVDVVDRNGFRESKLWASYCEHTFELLIQRAKEELDDSNSDKAGTWETTLNAALESVL